MDSVLPANEVIGNFLIVASSGEITITNRLARFTLRTGLKLVLMGFFWLAFIGMISDDVAHGGWRTYTFLPFLALLCSFYAGIQIIRGLLGSREIVHLSDQGIEITHADFQFHWRRRFFPIGTVQQITFAPVAHPVPVIYAKHGSGMGLRFLAGGKKIKILRGLGSPEAQKILSNLKGLGFDVVFDPGMKMMVEIEQSRRKSLLGRIFWGA